MLYECIDAQITYDCVSLYDVQSISDDDAFILSHDRVAYTDSIYTVDTLHNVIQNNMIKNHKKK